MSNLKGKIDDYLLAAQLLIVNCLSDPFIKEILNNFGYTEEKLTKGRALYDEVVALNNAQKKEFGEQIAATEELNELWDRADRQYMKTLKVARVALKDVTKADRATMLFGTRKESLSGWLEQVQRFYVNLLGAPELIGIMCEYGYTAEKLKAEAALVEQVAAKNFQQKKEMGEAQAATEARDKKLDELAAFISDLRAIAKVALNDDPQQLEKLGILARSPGAASRKQAAAGTDAVK
ncbi:MAG TPA: hypothetical protein VHY08_09630 [Bacillota bacterium]|nr:hypothetical protein [Bacillota bacterium]